jgi:hypothetical protein
MIGVSEARLGDGAEPRWIARNIEGVPYGGTERADGFLWIGHFAGFPAGVMARYATGEP